MHMIYYIKSSLELGSKPPLPLEKVPNLIIFSNLGFTGPLPPLFRQFSKFREFFFLKASLSRNTEYSHIAFTNSMFSLVNLCLAIANNPSYTLIVE